MKLVLLDQAPNRLDLFPILGHQGGWDEILLVAVPLLGLAMLLLIANRRVDAKLRNKSDETKPPSGP